jgi:ribosomal protein S18 acetylase RimI-like enzyme
VLGRAGEFEFGLPGTRAWIEIIGVDPAHRGQGIAQELVGQFAESAARPPHQDHFYSGHQQPGRDQHFFSRLGFVHGKMLHYYKELPGKQQLWNFYTMTNPGVCAKKSNPGRARIRLMSPVQKRLTATLANWPNDSAERA